MDRRVTDSPLFCHGTAGQDWISVQYKAGGRLTQ